MQTKVVHESAKTINTCANGTVFTLRLKEWGDDILTGFYHNMEIDFCPRTDSGMHTTLELWGVADPKEIEEVGKQFIAFAHALEDRQEKLEAAAEAIEAASSTLE